MTFLEAKQYLDSFNNYEVHLNSVRPALFHLDRVRLLLRLVGDPQKSLNIIHVAGSKGKGSTCALTATILQKAGYKVGLYTSPHFNNYRERIRVLELALFNRKPTPGIGLRFETSYPDIFLDAISEQELWATLKEIKPQIEKVRLKEELGTLSFFEVYTVLALYYFCKRQVDFAVMETGLGGRLDATNVVSSLVCAVTSISLEHTHFLGKSVAEIAREKAAIIKDHQQRVVLAPQDKEAKDILEKRCQQYNIQPYCVSRDIQYEFMAQNLEGQIFNIHKKGPGPFFIYSNLKLPLLGRHQLINATVAVAIVECLKDLGHDVANEAIYKGMEEVRWPGRFEIIKRDPLVILDSAHNQASCQSLVRTVQEILPQQKVVLILGISNDKDIQAICRELGKISQNIIVTKSKHPRARHITDEEAKFFFKNKKVVRIPSIDDALDFALECMDSNDMILVTGSIFIVAEARMKLVNSEKGPGPASPKASAEAGPFLNGSDRKHVSI